jgi:hypothetical protein
MSWQLILILILCCLIFWLQLSVRIIFKSLRLGWSIAHTHNTLQGVKNIGTAWCSRHDFCHNLEVNPTVILVWFCSRIMLQEGLPLSFHVRGDVCTMVITPYPARLSLDGLDSMEYLLKLKQSLVVTIENKNERRTKKYLFLHAPGVLGPPFILTGSRMCSAELKVGILKLAPSPAAAALALRCSRSRVSSETVQEALSACLGIITKSFR